MSQLGHKYLCLTCGMELGSGRFGESMDVIFAAILEHLAQNIGHEVVERFITVEDAT